MVYNGGKGRGSQVWCTMVARVVDRRYGVQWWKGTWIAGMVYKEHGRGVDARFEWLCPFVHVQMCSEWKGGDCCNLLIYRTIAVVILLQALVWATV